jgi:hypothetical protein
LSLAVCGLGLGLAAVAEGGEAGACVVELGDRRSRLGADLLEHANVVGRRLVQDVLGDEAVEDSDDVAAEGAGFAEVTVGELDLGVVRHAAESKEFGTERPASYPSLHQLP